MRAGAPSPDEATRSRVGAWLCLAGGGVGLLSLTSSSPGANPGAILLLSLVALGLSGGLALAGRRVSRQMMVGVAFVAIGLISVGLYYQGQRGHVYAFLYLWVLIYSAYFFTSRVNILLAGATGLAYAWVLVVRGGLSLVAWTIPMSTILIIGGLTHVLARRLGEAAVQAESGAASARQLAARLEALIDAAPLAVIELDEHGSVETWSAAAERILGWSRSSVIGRRCPLDLRAVDDPQQRGDSTLARTKRADGREITVDVSRVALPSSGGTIVMLADVSGRQELEYQQRRSQKMEAMGRLAAGVAHDVNNILLAVRSYSWLLQDPNPALPDHAHNVAQIEHAVERGAELTRQLLAFGKPELQRTETIDLAAAVKDLQGLLRPLIPEDVELTLEVPDEPALVRADRSQIGQVIMNLAVNARDAMPDGGRLTISVEIDREGQRPSGVVLRVADTGVGIAPEDERFIFEPFYSTKGDQLATGFGLATVYGIVTASGGMLDLSSTPMMGTVFTVRLPEAAPAQLDVAAIVPEATPGGHERLLLVEDDPDVRAPLVTALEHYGYDVIAAFDGADALEQVKSDPRPLDLVVTDVVMPRMSGPELVEQLHTTRPELPVLFISGYPARSHGLLNQRSSESGGRWSLLQKPFSPDELATEIRRHLDGGPTSTGDEPRSVPARAA